MRSLLFVMVLLISGCGGSIKVKPTTPVGNIPQNYNQTPNIKTTSSSFGMWMTLWLSSMSIASFATYRTFKKK